MKETRFHEWLRKNKLTIEAFAQATRLQYGTVAKLAHVQKDRAGKDIARKAKSVTRRIIAEKYPDCPLVKEEV